MAAIDDYRVDLRAVDPEYKPIIPRDVGRDVAESGEVGLRGVTVQVRIEWGSGETKSVYLDVKYRVDQAAGTIAAHAIGDSHCETRSLNARHLAVGFSVGDRVVQRFVDDLDVDLDVVARTEQLLAASERDDDVAVHTRLEGE